VWRAARIAGWLGEQPRADASPGHLTRRTEELMKLGFRNFDAFHLASAELANADAFVTTDDRLLSLAGRLTARLTVRVVDVVTLAQEIVR
jgi:hypothetical protein